MKFYDNDGIVIRTYEDNDISSIIELFDDKQISEYKQVLFLLTNITNELDRILVVTKDDKVIGLADLMAYPEKICINKIIINSDYQGQGYDRILLDTIKNIGNNEDRDIVHMGNNEYLSVNGFDKGDIGLIWKHTKQDMGIPKIFIDKEIQKNMSDDFDAAKAAQDLYNRGIKF